MAAEAFPDRWFTGFGFGNWRFYVVDEWNRFFPNVATQVWPPHNTFVQAWTNAGVISLALTIALVAVSLVAALRRIGEARTGRLLGSVSVARGLVLVGLMWVLLHGMLDTTDFAGDNHTLPFYAVLVALAVTPRPADSPSARVAGAR